MTQYGKPAEVYGFQTLFREIGYNISRLEQYETSLRYFDEALKKTPHDKRALIGRSRARAKVSQYEGALDDINKALGLEADDLVVLADKALNTYLCCEFEDGLVQNSRLVPKRQKPENFAMGVMQCSDAIENCVGERTGRPLRDHFMIVRKLAWKKNYAAQKPFEPKATNKPKKKKLHILGHVVQETYELAQPKKLRSKKSKPLMRKMIAAYDCKDLKEFLELVKKLKRFCDSKPKKLLPDKHVYIDQIYDKVCKAWYEYYRVNPTQSIHDQHKRIYAILGLPLSREPSADSVIGQFKNVFIDYKKEILDLGKTVEEANWPEEICWYYHELSRYNFEIKKYDLSRVYARKCIHEAEAIENSHWIFNSLMIMIKSNLAEHNKNDAKNDVARAMTCAEDLNDTEKINYLKKCLEVVESCEFEDVFGEKQLERRENKIIQMMASSKMRDEVAHLFRQMAAMPASRRMVVIPGVRAEEKAGIRPSKGRTMSIMPGTTTEDPELKSLPLKRSSFDSPGLQMMDLIQFHV